MCHICTILYKFCGLIYVIIFFVMLCCDILYKVLHFVTFCDIICHFVTFCDKPFVVEFQAVNKEMLGRGQVDHLVRDNFDFEDWTPIESSNRRSRDFETVIVDTDVAEDRTSYATETDSTQFVDLQSRQREARKRNTDSVENKIYYPSEEASNGRTDSVEEISNEIVDNSVRPERESKSASTECIRDYGLALLKEARWLGSLLTTFETIAAVVKDG